jgi:hypothetical protein
VPNPHHQKKKPIKISIITQYHIKSDKKTNSLIPHNYTTNKTSKKKYRTIKAQKKIDNSSSVCFLLLPQSSKTIHQFFSPKNL